MDQPQMNAEERRYKHAVLTEQIIGVFYEVYNELGIGFLEKVYQEAMTLVLKNKGLDVQCEVPVPVWFRGTKIGAYEADLVVAGCVLVELKAGKALDSSHEAQLLNYLRSHGTRSRATFQFWPQATGETFCIRQ